MWAGLVSSGMSVYSGDMHRGVDEARSLSEIHMAKRQSPLGCIASERINVIERSAWAPTAESRYTIAAFAAASGGETRNLVREDAEDFFVGRRALSWGKQRTRLTDPPRVL
jgi:hypothetical protein